jgi:hypothetical protein
MSRLDPLAWARARTPAEWLALGAALGVLAAVKKLNRVRDDFHLRSLAAVLRLPRGPVESAVHADPPALGKVIRQHFGLVSEHLHVEEVRLIDPVPGVVLLAAVDR